MEFRRNILLMYKEVLHNIQKHARATQVRILINEDPGCFTITIEDNGVGFDTALPSSGNGLKQPQEPRFLYRGNTRDCLCPRKGNPGKDCGENTLNMNPSTDDQPVTLWVIEDNDTYRNTIAALVDEHRRHALYPRLSSPVKRPSRHSRMTLPRKSF